MSWLNLFAAALAGAASLYILHTAFKIYPYKFNTMMFFVLVTIFLAILNLYIHLHS